MKNKILFVILFGIMLFPPYSYSLPIKKLYKLGEKIYKSADEAVENSASELKKTESTLEIDAPILGGNGDITNSGDMTYSGDKTYLLGVPLHRASEKAYHELTKESQEETEAKNLKKLIESAQNGNSKSQFLLGWKYSSGDGVKKDLSKAKYWYQLSAEQGVIESQFNLALIFSKEDDFVNAYKYFLMAAEQGDDHSQYAIGIMNEKGQGVAQDLEKAEMWYSKSASQGNEEALFAMGDIYRKRKDYEKAKDYFLSSANKGHFGSQYYLGMMYQLGLGVEKNIELAEKWYLLSSKSGRPWSFYSLAYLYESQERYDDAITYYLKSAKLGDIDSQYRLARLYEWGLGVENDKNQAILWYTKAANQGHLSSKIKLSRIYESDKQYKKAFEFALSAAEQGDSNMQNTLAIMYEDGVGVDKDVVKAEFWYLKSAQQDNVYAHYNLGLLYESLGKNELAYKNYSFGAENGHSYSQERLGWMLLTGKGVDKDRLLAGDWFKKSCEQNADPCGVDGIVLPQLGQDEKLSKNDNKILASLSKELKKELKKIPVNTLEKLSGNETFEFVPYQMSYKFGIDNNVFELKSSLNKICEKGWVLDDQSSINLREGAGIINTQDFATFDFSKSYSLITSSFSLMGSGDISQVEKTEYKSYKYEDSVAMEFMFPEEKLSYFDVNSLSYLEAENFTINQIKEGILDFHFFLMPSKLNQYPSLQVSSLKKIKLPKTKKSAWLGKAVYFNYSSGAWERDSYEVWVMNSENILIASFVYDDENRVTKMVADEFSYLSDTCSESD